MKSWKEENLLNEGIGTVGKRPILNKVVDRFTTKRTISGYEPTATDRSEMKMNATDLSKMLYKLCDIAGGKSNENFEEIKAQFEDTLKMFYSMLDDVRR